MADKSIEDMAEEDGRKRGKKPGLTQSEITERNLAMIRDRLRGQSWTHLAKKYDLTDDHCRRTFGKWREENQSTYQGRDPIQVVHTMLDRLDSWVEQLAEIADDAEADQTKIVAINSQMNAMSRAAELMQATGLLPHDLGTLRVEMDVQLLAVKLVQVLTEHNAPVELKRAMLGALQSDALPLAQLSNGAS